MAVFVQLYSNSFVMCHVQIFEQTKMDGWMEVVAICSLHLQA